ncbi:MAG: DUF262 domain-containing protein, partial [Clostridiales Family XIII bacterium]|jgi:hypothetical protein|nr:DUF262 domain-containing protein [Clostridiales Family XIII bacterium]
MKMLTDESVKIPIMQRDYAQGRENKRVKNIRSLFLDAIFKAINDEKPLALDFVYGYTDSEKKSLYPLDGQQRLTTLYLIHWYVAARESHLDDVVYPEINPQVTAKELLSKFSYETRHSSRVFCAKLSGFKPNTFEENFAEYLEQEHWFIPSWRSDATIHSMLVVLQAIHEKYSAYALTNAWEKLVSKEHPVIVFHLLPMQDFGLSDELYIKMNSRGKELTDFENFKATFANSLNLADKSEFEKRVDGEWTDLFWSLFKGGSGDISSRLDSGFMNFYKYSFSILDKSEYKRWFAWLDILAKQSTSDFAAFKDVLYISDNYEDGKVKLFFNNSSVNLFRKCCTDYNSERTTNPFSLGEQLMLYAFLIHLERNTSDFDVRVRQLRNLLSNSDDTLREEYRTALLEATEMLIINGISDIKNISGRHFSVTQIENELSKSLLYSDNDARKLLHRLEDNPLLRGCTSSIKYQDLSEFRQKASLFISVFADKCDLDLVGRALLSIGDYSQKQSSNYRFGIDKDSIWRELLTPSTSRKHFDHLQKTLSALLTKLNVDLPITEQLNQIIKEFTDSCEAKNEFAWRYYAVKYEWFRNSESGCYRWDDKVAKQYETIMLNKTQLNGYHWDPYLYVISEMISQSSLEPSMDYDNRPLIFGDKINAENKNASFVFRGGDQRLVAYARAGNLVQMEDAYEFPIQQVNGIDSEDRIKKCVKAIRDILAQPES